MFKIYIPWDELAKRYYLGLSAERDRRTKDVRDWRLLNEAPELKVNLTRAKWFSAQLHQRQTDEYVPRLDLLHLLAHKATDPGVAKTLSIDRTCCRGFYRPGNDFESMQRQLPAFSIRC